MDFDPRSQITVRYCSSVQLLFLDIVVPDCSPQYTFEYAYLYFKQTFQIETNMVLDKYVKTISK